MTIELYVFPPSPRAFKVMAIANHLGIETKLHFVDLVKAHSGRRTMPHLIPTCGCPRSRTATMCCGNRTQLGQYLASKKPESDLLPKDERGRLDVTRWQFWELAHWDPSCATFIFENVVKPVVMKMGEPDAAALAKGAENFHRAAKVLDAQLKGRRFVTGDTLTLADFALGATLNLADMARIPVEPYGEIKRWYGTLRALPAWQKTLTQCAMPPAAAA
jgi:glutathione S-transferase